MPNIVSDEDFEPSEITRKNKVPDENLEGTEDGHADVSVTLICLHLPLHEHLIIQLLPESCNHRSTEAMNPLS
jgi:hypothetical protein